MNGGIGRRTLLVGCLGGLGLAAVGCASGQPPDAVLPGVAAGPETDPKAALETLESGFGGRIGVYGVDTGDGGATFVHRSDERFPMCSTSKVLAVSAVLRLRLEQPGLLERRIRYQHSQLVSASPVTSRNAAAGMTVSALCEAAITQSDNTAANLLVALLGGPAAVTAFARTLGDPLTRQDRLEPDLNVVSTDEARDTSTPAQMAADLRALVLGDALDQGGREQLTDWLVANTTGGTQIGAGLPAGWRIADKTGVGARGELNDIAVTWPPGRAPLVIAIYTVPGEQAGKPDDQVVASAAAITARALVPAA